MGKSKDFHTVTAGGIYPYH